MMTKVICLVFLALFFVLLPVRRAAAATWEQAYSNCEGSLAQALQITSTGSWEFKPVACVAVSDSSQFRISTDNPKYPLVGCSTWGVIPPGTCYWSGVGPPDCTAGRVDAGDSVANVSSWSDGTSCDGGCMTGQFLGGSMNGAYYYTGAYCPYDSSADPPDAPPPSSAAAQPPACNADGSCVTCSGSLCATTGVPPPPAPPPPASGSSSGNHSTTYNNTTNNSYSSSTAYSGGASGSSTGGSGSSMDGVTGTTSGTGTSDSQGECDSGACDVGEADGQLGGLYQHSSQTPQGMFTNFIGQVKASPVISATTGFFEVQAGGSCPSWHIPGNKYWGEAGFDFSFFCDPAFLAIFQLAGYLVLAGGAFCAFRIALY